jgi:acid phosphatase family membrane protein YuiD
MLLVFTNALLLDDTAYVGTRYERTSEKARHMNQQLRKLTGERCDLLNDVADRDYIMRKKHVTTRKQKHGRSNHLQRVCRHIIIIVVFGVGVGVVIVVIGRVKQ